MDSLTKQFQLEVLNRTSVITLADKLLLLKLPQFQIVTGYEPVSSNYLSYISEIPTIFAYATEKDSSIKRVLKIVDSIHLELEENNAAIVFTVYQRIRATHKLRIK